MIEAKTTPAKYIFLDVVSFTQNRSVEAQTNIVNNLNRIVKASIDGYQVPEDKVIFLPTGDGLCIVLLNVEDPYDIHLLIALRIIKGVHEHSENTEDNMRRFQVRIGINANIDNLVIDINGNKNIAGAGINMAFRVMSVADGNQILVSQAVFDVLQYREKYMHSFRGFRARFKQEIKLVYQYIEEDHAGLNTETPQVFQTTERGEPKLTKLAAYYFAHAIKNRELFFKKIEYLGLDAESGIILLWFLARDSLKVSETPSIEKPLFQAYRAGEASIEEQLEYYSDIDVSVQVELTKFILKEVFSDFFDCFESGTIGSDYRFINSRGIEKLKSEWPDIWAELGLNNQV